MKTTVLAIALAAVWGSAGLVVRAEEGQTAPPAATATNEVTAKAQTACQITGVKINKDLYVDYKGKRIYVCCKMCLPEVEKDPATYIAKLEKLGGTLDKTPSKK